MHIEQPKEHFRLLFTRFCGLHWSWLSNILFSSSSLWCRLLFALVRSAADIIRQITSVGTYLASQHLHFNSRT